jgi:hypothetical protein
LDRRLGKPQGQSGLGGEEKNFGSMPRIEPLIIQLVVQLLRLLFLSIGDEYSAQKTGNFNTK